MRIQSLSCCNNNCSKNLYFGLKLTDSAVTSIIDNCRERFVPDRRIAACLKTIKNFASDEFTLERADTTLSDLGFIGGGVCNKSLNNLVILKKNDKIARVTHSYFDEKLTKDKMGIFYIKSLRDTVARGVRDFDHFKTDKYDSFLSNIS